MRPYNTPFFPTVVDHLELEVEANAEVSAPLEVAPSPLPAVQAPPGPRPPRPPREAVEGAELNGEACSLDVYRAFKAALLGLHGEPVEEQDSPLSSLRRLGLL